MSSPAFGSFKLGLALVMVWGLSACIAPGLREDASRPSADEVEALTKAVVDTSGADTDTARRFATLAFSVSRDLAREYKLVQPPLLHNSLVNAGLRERGLCHQFADDLAVRLLAAGPWPWELRPVVARQDSYWRVHHGIVIGQNGTDLARWLVFDPWRNSGELFWAYVGEDTVPWQWWVAPEAATD